MFSRACPRTPRSSRSLLRPEQLKATLQSGHFYVIDRGYAGYQLFRDILDAGSSFVGRVKDNTAVALKVHHAAMVMEMLSGNVLVSKLRYRPSQGLLAANSTVGHRTST